jgi:hypothetical protein
VAALGLLFAQVPHASRSDGAALTRLALSAATPVALASDTISDGHGHRRQRDHAARPGARDAEPDSPLLRGARAFAFVLTLAVNRWLISVVHRFQGGNNSSATSDAAAAHGTHGTHGHH